MRSNPKLAALLVMTSLLWLPPRDAVAQQQQAQQGAPELLTQVQAADVLSDLITYTVGRADARVANMQQYLRETGDEAAFAQARPAAKDPLLPFSELSRAAVVFVNGDGGKYVDPSLKTLNAGQLASELTELQIYNIQQFRQLNDDAKSFASMKEFLKSRGGWDKYATWAKSKGFTLAKPPQTVEEAAALMDEMAKSAQEIAWTKAQAQGMSRAEFDKRWADQVKNYKASVDQKVLGCRALASQMMNPPPLPPPPPMMSPREYDGPPPGMRGGPSLSRPPLSGQYQQENTAGAFKARDDSLWNEFDDG